MYKEKLIPIGMFEEEKKYWLGKLAGGLSELHLITDFPRSTGYARNIYKMSIQDKVVNRLKHISKNNDLSLFVLFLSTFKILLFKYSRQSEIIISSPVFAPGKRIKNRSILFRDFIYPGMMFKEILLTVRQTVADGYKNQYYPLDRILNLLSKGNKINFNRFVLIFENIHDKEFSNAISDNFENDLMISFREIEGKLEAELSYNADIFKDETMHRFLNCYLYLLSQVSDNTNININDIEMANDEEKKEILINLNQIDTHWPLGKTVISLFEEQVVRTPGNTAIHFHFDWNDIFPPLESSKTNLDAWDRICKYYFKINSFIYKTVVSTPGRSGDHAFLKTHRHNSIVVNSNMVKVLELFDGTRSLETLFSFLQSLDLSLVIYSLKQQDVIELSYEFNDKPEKFAIKTKEDFMILVKSMFRHHLLELVGHNLQNAKEKTPLLWDRLQEEPAEAEIPLNSLLNQDRTLSNAPILFLGDTPGVQTTGLLYLASYLRRNGIKSYCQFYNTNWTSTELKNNIETLLKEIRPGIVAISMKWFPHMARVLETCRMIKEFSDNELFYDINVVVGGNTASYFAKEIIRYEWVDYVIRGDGEIPLLQLCRGEEKIANCLYKKNGIIVENSINYQEDENYSPDIYLSHLNEIMISRFAPLPATFFIYTHKGCGMDCFYCGGCNSANKKIFNRTRLFIREVEAVRKDIYEAKKYASTFMFDFDAPNVNLLAYCRDIWEGIDLSSHFAIFTNLIPPSPELMALVNRTFKYVYWNLDVASLSGRHRKHLYSLGLVKPQPTDDEILAVFSECEKYKNAEVRLNLIAGLPYFTAEDIALSDNMLSRILNRYTCCAELHWARLHAEPGAPVVESAGKYGMYSLATSFEDFLKYSRMNFNNEYNVEYYNYPYIYFKDEEFNSKISNFYSETNIKVEMYKKQKRERRNFYRKCSYLELNEKANRMAVMLREKGVVNNSIVGLLTQESQEVAVGILGILKAEGAYLPIEPDIPTSRKKYMIEDSDIKVLLTGTSFFDNEELNSTGVSIIPLMDNNLDGRGKTNLDSTLSTSDLAYLIYTSGTTGSPRGVLIDHHGLVNYSNWRIEAYRLTENDITLEPLTFGFDGFGSNFYSSLLSGGKLVMVPNSKKGDYQYIKEILKMEGVTNISLVPGMYEVLTDIAEEDDLHSLRFVVLAGEKAHKKLLDKSLEKSPAIFHINEYGPTESTVTASARLGMDAENTAVIGTPIANTCIYIMDDAFKIVPTCVPGQLFIEGVGIARGYLNNPELTREKFILYNSDKFHMTCNPNRIYKTGDLARWLPKGEIEFLGRIDQQVKIRGFRIEVEEIETQLRRCDKVKDAVVVVRDFSQVAGSGSISKYLCIYAVADESLDFSLLKDFLAERLPGYMIPSYFIQLEKIPLTVNGKLDTRALPLPEIKGEFIAPHNENEKKLAGIWAEVLGVDKEKIGLNSNFFDLGGHSLSANTVAARIHKEFNVKNFLAQIFETPTIKSLAEKIKKVVKDEHISIKIAEAKEYYELSSAQKRLYVLQQMVPENTSYNIPFIIPLLDNTEEEKLRTVFKILIQRHESLRTSFITLNEAPLQRIHREVDFSIGNYEASKESEQENLIAFLKKSFDLSKAPLLRVKMVNIGSSHRVLFIDMHHIISDGTSQYILEKEFNALYAREELPPLRLQYKDYSEWYNSPPQQEAIKKQESYWLQEFFDEIPVLNLPTDYPRPLVKGIEGNAVNFIFDVQETKIVKTIVKENSLTLYMGLLALFNVLLSKLSGQEDIIIGTPIAARGHADLQKVIGMLVNTLAMRNYPSGDKFFKEFLQEVKIRALAAFKNQEYPFEELVDNITLNRDTGRNPVFDVMFSLQNIEEYKNEAAEITEQDSYLHIKGTSKFDLNLAAIEIGDRILCRLQYSTSLFKPESIEKIIGYFKNILKELSRDTCWKISRIEIMDKAEKEELLRLSQGMVGDYERMETLQGLFERQVEKKPDHIVVVGPSISSLNNNGADVHQLPIQISYRELNNRSNHLARQLKIGSVKPRAIVGILVEPSLEMMLGIAGILKAGGCFLPIEPKTPRERINFVLNDSNVDVLLTRPSLSRSFKAKVKIINLENTGLNLGRYENPTNDTKPVDPVYVIYTSGTTGKPKGVLIANKNHLNYAYWLIQTIGLTSNDSTILTSSFAFDILYTQLFSSLLTGCQLHVIPRETYLFSELLFRYLRDNEISYLKMTPSLFNLVVNSPGFSTEMLRALRFVLLGGEEIIVKDVEKAHMLCPHLRMMNHYGPTETTIGTITQFIDFDKFEEYKITPTIGRPILNTRVYILDKLLSMVPIGIVGGLHIGGDGVGMGYLNKPELTSKKFINGLFAEKNAVYFTGDLACWNPCGNVRFLGRIDHQIKIRGYRIELAEIESCLLKYDDIMEAVVIVKEKNNVEKFLCAYYVSGKVIDITALREFLAEKLPQYMIPSYFVHLEKMPLTKHNKLNRWALPEPSLQAVQGDEAPRNELEERLVELWAEILGIEKKVTGIDRNFFQLGGHSLKATIMAAKIHKEFNVKIPLVEIFKTPNIRGLAAYIKGSTIEKYIAIKSVEKKEYYVLSPAQKRLYILDRIEPTHIAYNMPYCIPLPPYFDVEKLGEIFMKLIERHESFRTSFHMVNDEPVQRIWEAVDFGIEYIDLKYSREELQVRNIIQDFTRPFDLAVAPLLRVALIMNRDGTLILLADMHHIISDEISHEVLTADFIRLYDDRELTPLRLAYKDYSEWQNHLMRTGAIKKQEEYWFSELGGKIPLLDIPLDYERSVEMRFEGSSIHFEIDETLTKKVKKCAEQFDVSLMMMLLSVYNILLAALAGREEIIVGTVAAGRRHADMQKIIGFFVNMLAIKTSPGKDKLFSQYLAEVRNKTLNAFENQEYPFEELVNQLDIQREPGRHPLVDVVFVFRDANNPHGEVKKHSSGDSQLNSLEVSHSQGETEPTPPNDSLLNFRKISHFDLMMHSTDTGPSIHMIIEYSTVLFKRVTIEEFSRVYLEILAQVLENDDIQLSALRISHDLMTANADIIRDDTDDWDL